MSDQKNTIDFESISMLMPKAKVGDDAARNEICRQVVDYLQLMAERELDAGLRRKLNPSDVVQQAMARMIGGIEDFRGRSSREFYGWLNKILRNEIKSCRRNLHRAKRDVRRENEINSRIQQKPESNDPLLTPSSEAIRKETIDKFESVLSTLSENYSTVIRLRNIDELTFREIAQRMGKTEASVTNLWYRAIVRFQEEFSRQEG